MFHNHKVKLPHPTLSQIYELYQNVPSRFTFSLLLPMSSTHLAPNFAPFITQSSFPSPQSQSRHLSPSTHQDISLTKDTSPLKSTLLPIIRIIKFFPPHSSGKSWCCSENGRSSCSAEMLLGAKMTLGNSEERWAGIKQVE